MNNNKNDEFYVIDRKEIDKVSGGALAVPLLIYGLIAASVGGVATLGVASGIGFALRRRGRRRR